MEAKEPLTFRAVQWITLYANGCPVALRLTWSGHAQREW